jgi:curved DNA-binding protein CbpA
MKVNYYEVLGVERSASESDIRERFRKLARENHPDRYRGPDKNDAERKFQTLTEAVNVLTNPVRRKQHDAELSSGKSAGAADFTQVAKAYLAKGVKAYKDGDIRAAYENFDMAVKHNPNDAKAFHYLAIAAMKIPSYARQAVQAIETAVQKEPVNPTYLKDAGLICKRAGLPAKAERYLDEALKWDPENAEVQTALADLRLSRGESKEGAKGFTLFSKKS